MVVTIDNVPVYNATISDEETGMFKISLVDEPAVMSNFLAFDKTRKPLMYAIANEEKRIVRGVVMRADFPIYRYDEKFGEYYIIYKADTIRQMAEKYLLESRQNDVNLMHEENSDVDGVQMVQYFIKDTGAGVNPTGFEDIADGSLFAEFHIVNDDVWGQVKDGTFKGYSLEGVFDLVPEQDEERVESIVDSLEGKFNKLFKNFNMSKFKRFKAALAKVLAEFANVTTDKGVLSWDGEDDLKAGDSVYVEDADGNRTPAEDGDYKTTDGKTIKVADGKVTEIVEESAEEEGDNPPTEVAARKQSIFSKIAAAFSESYDEKTLKILDAILALGYSTYGWIWEAGDDYAIFVYYGDETNWEDKFLKFAITWDADGNPIIGDSIEVKRSFVPVDEPNPAEQVETLSKENADLKKQVQELKNKPLAKPAHEEHESSVKMQKTGDKGLDRLASRFSKK